ncbi:hypothetical protein VTO58DRAFT_107808 [Aureobasidium pullulans]
MSDAADTTFSVGETKLLISIIKNLEGDLQIWRFDRHFLMTADFTGILRTSTFCAHSHSALYDLMHILLPRRERSGCVLHRSHGLTAFTLSHSRSYTHLEPPSSHSDVILSYPILSDWDAVAGEMNYKDGTIARARWNQTRRKKILGTGASTTKTTKKPAGTKKGTAAKTKTQTKKKIDSDDEDEEDQDEIKVAVKKEEDNDAEAEDASEEEEIEVKKPVAAKRKVAAKAGRAAAKPKATTNKRKPATFTTSSEDEDDEKNIKRLKRAAAPKTTIETATDSADAADSSVVVETTEGATVAETATDDSNAGNNSSDDAVMGADRDDDEKEEVVKKEVADEEEDMEDESEV